MHPHLNRNVTGWCAEIHEALPLPRQRVIKLLIQPDAANLIDVDKPLAVWVTPAINEVQQPTVSGLDLQLVAGQPNLKVPKWARPRSLVKV